MTTGNPPSPPPEPDPDPAPDNDSPPPPPDPPTPPVTRWQRVVARLHRMTVWPGWMQVTAVVTSIAAISALFFTARTVQFTNAQLGLAQQTAATESLSKAAERLAADRPEARMAGIYILERLADETPDARTTVVDILAAFVRGRAPLQDCVVPDQLRTARVPADVTAAMTVLGRMPRDRGELLDLTETCLVGLKVVEGDFSNTDLSDANLSMAVILGGNWSQSLLLGTTLNYAHFVGTNLFAVVMLRVTAINSAFTDANVTDATMSAAQLEAADFSQALGVQSINFDDIPPTCNERTVWPPGFVAPCQHI
ncbi:pentapeptide repeat-containing protein [Nocardia uniformis]|uniref:Pentapeptide repeat-containing protein n=1 Tax=Nocardia uniformis TaxID=53432 RepID=A0A849CHU7_9NOCA|nr:pentapeptide repeat-containing protein [Nocardia uniformis]NNH75639.1 pentapeptide repeat-containing protein [Nocardia uniformis]